MSINTAPDIKAYGESFEYSLDNRIMLNWYADRIIAFSGKKQRVLELGIGHAFTCLKFYEFFNDYTVVDASSDVIQKCRQDHPELADSIRQAFFEDFEPEKTFDIIILGFVLEHVEDPGAVIRKYKSFLSPGGKYYITVPNAESLHRRFGHAAGLLGDVFTLGSGDKMLGHRRLYSVDSLNALLEDCGLHVTRKEGIFLKPFTTNQILQLGLGDAVYHAMCEVGIAYPELCAAFLMEAQANKNE
ncbi:class I SAM-dependent methyltransferase [Desulfovibrio sp. OttesenSCG-928-C14]|nr:class I SAM-dependent methyltransferase [Desulfovibrio sp. OttesenSCG-928-C14]